MSRLPESFLEELRNALPAPQLVGRRVRLTRKAGRTHVGCCPFHNEKSPSFYVYGDHFHCFGCGAHGDIIAFEMRLGGGEFRDVVERLAAEAGLRVPVATPQEAAKARQQGENAGTLELACRAFERRLWEAEGAAGLAYLRRRGLTDATIRSWRLGWSGPGRGSLAAELAQVGVTQQALVEAGLMLERDGRRLDLFFDRVMFPIWAPNGRRIISFSGRVLGDAKPKYVNGPETALFKKGAVLFGQWRAREAVMRGQPLLAVEGQMDVVALHQAGFTGAVAPLGTALTDQHLQALWRASPEPVLAFDGDAAGRRAMLRAVEMMLPQLQPDRSCRVLLLAAGHDPDSLLREGGEPAMQAALEGAAPLVQALYGLLVDGQPRATPEQRAALRQRLTDAADRIGHRYLAGEYKRELLRRLFEDGGRSKGPARLVASAPRLPDPAAAQDARIRLALGCRLAHPDLEGAVDLERLEPADPALRRLVEALRQDTSPPDPVLAAALAKLAPADAADAEALALEISQGQSPEAIRGDIAAEAARFGAEVSAASVARIIALRRAELGAVE